MTPQKQTYIEAIRANTAYPMFRWLIEFSYQLALVFVGLDLLLSITVFIVVLFNGPAKGYLLVLLLVVAAVVGYIAARAAKEGALILVDIGDSLTEVHSRL